MKTTILSPRQALLLAVSILALASLACGLITPETPATEPAQTASTPVILAPSESAPSGEGGDLMAFTSGGSIYVMPVGGEDVQPLTGSLIMMALEGEQGVRLLTDDDGGLRWDPAWSPDGSQLAFVSESDDGDGYEIYVVEADGSNVRRLTRENHYNSSPAWSPDGSQIAFVDDSAIYVMEANGSNLRRLTYEYWNDDPTWSPDGSQIAFVSDRDGYEIYVMEAADENSIHRLTNNDIWEKNLAWSPDGGRITFESFDPDQTDNSDIYVLELESGVVHRLTDDTAADRSPTWSPDGSRIAFSSERDGSGNLYVMDADGSNVRPLTKDTDWVESPAWRPDRDRVVVVAAKAPILVPSPAAPKPGRVFDCTTYTTADGLVDNGVNAMAIAPDGVLWVGTGGANGVARFDGENWRTYTEDDGLYSNMVYAIAVAPDGALWAATAWGAFRFDGTTSTTYDVGAIELVTVAPDGAVWIGSGRIDTDRNTISRFDGDRWTNYDTPDDLENTRFDAIAGAFDGSVWMAGTEFDDSGPVEHLYRFDGKNWTPYTTADGLADDRVFSIATTPDGAVWFGTQNGVSRFDGETWTTYTENDGLAANSVLSFGVAPDGALWAGTWFGISYFDGERWVTYTTDNGLPGNRIELIAVASDGTLWITHYDDEDRLGGVSHCTSTVGAVQPVSTPASSNHSPKVLDHAVIDTVENNSLGEIVGVTTTIVMNAFDSDGDPLSFTWTASNGSITGDGQTGIWKRELTDEGHPKDGVVTVIITDDHGGQAKYTFTDE